MINRQESNENNKKTNADRMKSLVDQSIALGEIMQGERDLARIKSLAGKQLNEGDGRLMGKYRGMKTEIDQKRDEFDR